MAAEGIEIIYQENLTPLDPAPLENYLSNIPGTETFNAPQEIIKNPGTVTERLATVAEVIRMIETARSRIAWHGSVLAEAARLSPETIDALPDNQRQQVLELIGRISLEDDQPKPL